MSSNGRIHSDLDPDAHLLSLLQVYQPRKIFVLSATGLSAINVYQKATGCEVVSVIPECEGFTGESLICQSPVEFAVVVDIAAKLPKRVVPSVIGTIRNMIAPKIAAYESASARLQENEWFALGFKQLATFTTDANPSAEKSLGRCQLAYGYDLGHYNQKRDWNNPKYWANPEMWDKQ